MNARPHTLKGRQVEIKRAMPRDVSSQNPENNVTVKKIFLGGLKDAHNEQNLKEYFGKYGVYWSLLKSKIIYFPNFRYCRKCGSCQGSPNR